MKDGRGRDCYLNREQWLNSNKQRHRHPMVQYVRRVDQVLEAARGVMTGLRTGKPISMKF